MTTHTLIKQDLYHARQPASPRGETLCDVCMNPGACCSRVRLNGRLSDGTLIHGPKSRREAERNMLRAGLPFWPSAEDEGGWWYTCLALDGRTGRCARYEDRPQLCKDLAPGEEVLCVHHWSAPS